MTVLRTLRKLILGETWWLPLGVALVVGAGAIARAALPARAWADLGGPALLLGVVVVLVTGVARTSRLRR